MTHALQGKSRDIHAAPPHAPAVSAEYLLRRRELTAELTGRRFVALMDGLRRGQQESGRAISVPAGATPDEIEALAQSGSSDVTYRVAPDDRARSAILGPVSLGGQMYESLAACAAAVLTDDEDHELVKGVLELDQLMRHMLDAANTEKDLADLERFAGELRKVGNRGAGEDYLDAVVPHGHVGGVDIHPITYHPGEETVWRPGNPIV